MSGSPLCPWAYQAPEEAIQHARDLAALLGFLRKDKTGLLNFFLRTPAPDIVIASTNVGLVIALIALASFKFFRSFLKKKKNVFGREYRLTKEERYCKQAV